MDLRDFPKIKCDIKSITEFNYKYSPPSCVIMDNEDIHFMNFNSHKVTNIKDIIPSYNMWF